MLLSLSINLLGTTSDLWKRLVANELPVNVVLHISLAGVLLKLALLKMSPVPRNVFGM
jgi:hypothetical protein